MTVKRHLLSRALLLVVVVAAVLVPGAVAYIGQNPYAVHLDGPSGVVACSSEVVITATVRFAETGSLVSGQAVEWDLKASRSPDDRLSARSTITGDDGKTSVILSFGQADGARTVRATIATWPATIVVTCRGATATPTTVPTATPTATPTTRPTATPIATPTTVPTATSTAAATTPPASLPATPPPSASPDVTPTPIPTGAGTSSPSPTASMPAATIDPSGSPSGRSSGADLAPMLLVVLLAVGAGGVLLMVRARR